MDWGFPDKSELSLDPDGTPHLKLQQARPLPIDLNAFHEAVHARMPERHLLDALFEQRSDSASAVRFLKSGNPIEQAKQDKSMDLVANIMDY